MTTPTYPKRPPFFSHKFTRLLFRSCVGAQIGPDATLLLIAVAHCEDARHYSGPVKFFASNLADQIGLSVSSMERARARAVAAGWLVYIPGAKRRAARYFVAVPDAESVKPDGPLDEDDSDILRQPDGVSGEHLTEQAVSKWGESDGVSGEQANHHLPSSLFPNPSSQECANRSGSPASDDRPAKAKRKAATAKTPSGPHQEAVAAFCDAWRGKYGAKYAFEKGKDGTHVRDMLAHLDGNVSRFREVVSRFLADDDKFYRDGGHTVGMLRASLNRWLTVKPAGSPHVGTHRPPLLQPGQKQTHEIAPANMPYCVPDDAPARPLAKGERF